MNFTICANCKYYFKTNEGIMWYDQFCGNYLVERKKNINPVTGYEEYEHGGQQYPYARDINKGDCEMWNERREND